MEMRHKKRRGKMSPPPTKKRKRRGGKKGKEMSREDRIKMGEDALGDQPF